MRKVFISNFSSNYKKRLNLVKLELLDGWMYVMFVVLFQHVYLTISSSFYTNFVGIIKKQHGDRWPVVYIM